MVCVLFFWKLTLTDEYVWFNHPDMCYLELPRLQFQAREFHEGRFPLWDPTLWMGQPHLGQTQPGPVFPLNILFSLLPLHEGYLSLWLLNWYFVAVHFFAALCAYALLRDLRRSRAASLFGAAAYAFAGFMATVAWLDVMNGAIWTPAICLFFLRAARGRSPVRNAAICGLVLGMAWLSGHHEVPALVSYALAAGWAWALWRRRAKAMVPAAITFVIAGLTAAVQLWPTAEFALRSQRWIGLERSYGWKDKIPYVAPTIYSLPPKALAGAIIHDNSSYADSSAFVGVAIAALAAYALCTGWRRPQVRWMAALLIGASAYSLGAFTPLQGWLFTKAPVLDHARVPSRAIHLWNFALVVLAVYGLDRLAEHPHRTWTRRFVYVLAALSGVCFTLLLVRRDSPDGIAIGAVASLLTAILFHTRPRGIVAAAGLAAVAMFEVYPVATHTYSSRYDKDGQQFVKNLTGHREIADFLRKEPAPRRLVVNDTDIPANFGGWYGFDVMEGYVAGTTENLLRHARHVKPVQDLFGITHFVGRKADRPEQVEVFTAASGIKVFRSPDALPRARSVHRVQHVKTDGELRARLEAADFDARTTVLLLNVPDPRLENCDGDDVRLLARGTNRIQVQATMMCRGLVVLSETFYPGWQATVDGHPAEVMEAYGALRGVAVDAGQHALELRYRPRSVVGGAGLTAAGLVLAAVLVILPLRRRQRPSH